jgi:ABC-type transport system involved in cytochrome c biogenesis permease subunit
VEKHLLTLIFLLLLVDVINNLVRLWKNTKLLRNFGSLLGWLTFVSFLGLMSFRIIAAHRAPFANMYEFTLLFTGFILIISIILRRTLLSPLFDLAVTLLLLVLLAVTSTISADLQPLMPALQSNWLHIHVATAIIAYGAFAAAFCLGIVYLAKSPDSTHELQQIDQRIYRLVVLGFTFLTFVIITGAIWAEQAWGNWWSWDPKETWSLITWIVYAVYLHARSSRQWKGRKTIWIVVIGFLVVLFTLFGVSILLPGLHSYA